MPPTPEEYFVPSMPSEARMAFAPPALQDCIGPYRIEEQLGGGGMGLVFRAKDTRLGRHVAIKIIRPESLNASTRAAFVREAQLASSLNHPGIVTIYDVMTHRDMECIVMEFVEGTSLASMMAAHPLPFDDVPQYVTQIGQALGAAHRGGIVHRDLKPGNIMVTPQGRTKIVDFGLSDAKRSQAEDDVTRPVSIFSGVVGTLAYMSPEHLNGETIDHRADLFALAVMLYQMLTGVLPFTGTNPAALMQALLWGEPALPSAIRAELAHFDRVIRRGLHRDPACRYQSADEMLADLNQVHAAGSAEPMRTVLTLQRGNTERMSSFSGAVSGRMSVPPSTGSERASIAVLPFSSVTKDTEDNYIAAGLASELVTALTGLPGLRIAPQMAAYREHERGADPIAVSRTLNTRYVLTGSLRRAGHRLRVGAELTDGVSEAVVWTRNYDRLDTDIFEVQEDIACSIVKSLGGLLIRAATDFAFQTPTDNLNAWGLLRKAYHIWNYQFSVEGVLSAIALCRRAVALDPEYSIALANLSVYLSQSVIHYISPSPETDHAEAIAAANHALELAPQDAEVLAATGLVFIHATQYERAVVNLRRATRVAPYDLVPWGYLGFGLACAGGSTELEEAITILTHLIADAPDHPSLPYWHQFAAIASLRSSKFEQAIAHAARAVELQPGFVFNQVFLGEALCRAGREEEARQAVSSIRLYNPAFTIAAFEQVALGCCRKQEYVEQLCASVRSLGLLQ